MGSGQPITVGAAMRASELPTYRDWLLAAQRDLEIQDAISPELLDGDWQKVAREIVTLLDGYYGRLGIHGPFIGLTIMARDPKIQAVVVERLQKALDFGAEIGATHMVVHSPFIFMGDAFTPHSIGFDRSEQIALVHQTMAPIVTQAEKQGCTLVIENIFDKNSEPLRALVQSFGSDYVKHSIDTGHAYLAQKAGGPTPDQWVRDTGPRLAHLHLQDTDGHYDRHWTVGNGAINWSALFEAIKELNHTPRMILELSDKSQIFEATRWLAEHKFAQ